MRYYRYPKYISVAEKQANAEKKLKQLKKKDPTIQPIQIKGKALAETWWGKEWNKNLERYADYHNRIGRGRSYVRHGAVLDLKIEPCKVLAQVLGSGRRPYKVIIDIKKISKNNWSTIKRVCKKDMENMQQLLSGKFPKKLADIFTGKGSGLFPAPREIHFSCSCPDSAVMCKHIAAVLYGIGARLDADPALFFILRKINMKDLISESIRESKKEILSKSGKGTHKRIKDDNALSEMFGIDLDGSTGKAERKTTSSSKPTPLKQKPSPSPRKRPGKKVIAKTVTGQTGNFPGTSPTDLISEILKKHKQEMTVSEIIKASALPDQKVRNILYRLKIKGIVKNTARGMYRSP